MVSGFLLIFLRLSVGVSISSVSKDPAAQPNLNVSSKLGKSSTWHKRIQDSGDSIRRKASHADDSQSRCAFVQSLKYNRKVSNLHCTFRYLQWMVSCCGFFTHERLEDSYPWPSPGLSYKNAARATHIIELFVIQLWEDSSLDLVGLHGDPIEDGQTILGLQLALDGHRWQRQNKTPVITFTKCSSEPNWFSFQKVPLDQIRCDFSWENSPPRETPGRDGTPRPPMGGGGGGAAAGGGGGGGAGAKGGGGGGSGAEGGVFIGEVTVTKKT